ncbi:MAG: GyrI-like domain-containing protein [Betaproteobacteria bacterium]|nr:GyrI-like domain-containing protein [Betaproteobacteria bacterium]
MNTKFWLQFLSFFVLPILLVLWFMGFFSGAHIGYAERGPYHYAYVVHEGDLAKIIDTQNRVYQILKQQGIAPGVPVARLLEDPRVTPPLKMKAEAGFLVAPGAPVRAPLRAGTIPARRVLLVTVKASPLLAPSKAYSALLDYLSAHAMKLALPTVELYQHGTLSVEMDVRH